MSATHGSVHPRTIFDIRNDDLNHDSDERPWMRIEIEAGQDGPVVVFDVEAADYVKIEGAQVEALLTFLEAHV